MFSRRGDVRNERMPVKKCGVTTKETAFFMPILRRRDRNECLGKVKEFGFSWRNYSVGRLGMAPWRGIPCESRFLVLPVHRPTRRSALQNDRIPKPYQDRNKSRCFKLFARTLLGLTPPGVRIHHGRAADLPLTALFIDCDSIFASVEQPLDLALRGRPVGTALVMRILSASHGSPWRNNPWIIPVST